MARLPYTKIKDDVLGAKYELSLAFPSPDAMRRAMKYKKRLPKKTSNVLAFPLSKTSGEILICKEVAAPFTVGYLFIHGLCHLKGYKHSATMESVERLYLKKWGLKAHE